MPQELGDPPQRPGSPDTATCPDCTTPLPVDELKCSSCGSRVWSKTHALLLVAFSLPLWAITVGVFDMLGSVSGPAARGFLIGMGLLGPLTTTAGIVKYRQRAKSLRGGA